MVPLSCVEYRRWQIGDLNSCRCTVLDLRAVSRSFIQASKAIPPAQKDS